MSEPHVFVSDELTDAIEIIDMCKPIVDLQGGMWFGRNHNMADATFVDYGACRAFAVAARSLPGLVNLNMELVRALQSIANNTCCDGCQEAARVARKALNAPVGGSGK